MTNVVHLKPAELYKLAGEGKRFILFLGKRHWITSYSYTSYERGDVIVYIGHKVSQSGIGVIRRVDNYQYGVRILPQENQKDLCEVFTTVHGQDILCKLLPYKTEDKDKLWRLWMEFPDFSGKIKIHTILIDEDKDKLDMMKGDLLKLQHDSFTNTNYQYFVEEVDRPK